jgi:hypothetical protein
MDGRTGEREDEVLSAVLVALTLEGVLPGLVRVRRPIPFVRYDRVREPRARADLYSLARRLVEADEPPGLTPYQEWRRSETQTGAGSAGAAWSFQER